MGSYDVVVVGAGIAGLSAAIYTSRHNLETLVVGKDLGGQLLLAEEIQNYPGYPRISGYELVSKVERQARMFGSTIEYDEVVRVGEEGEGFFVETASGSRHESTALILAFGKTPRDLGVPGEARLKGRGVSYCSICDAALYKGRRVLLVSWGEHSVEASSILVNTAGELYWVFPGDKPVGDEGLLERVLSSGRVELVPRSRVVEIKGGGRVESVVVEDLGSRRLTELKVDAVFIEIGYVAKTGFLKGFVELNDKGEVVVDEYCRTSRRGVFAAGDVTATPYKQAVIAAAQGVIAALSAYSYVMERKGAKPRVVGDWRKLPVAGEEEGLGFKLGYG